MSNTRRPRAKPAPHSNGDAPLDIAALLDRGKRAEKLVPLCLAGDLVAEIEAAEAELKRIRRPSDRLVGDPETTALAERIQELQQRMHAYTVPFILRSVGRVAFRDFALSHQPRDGNQQDHAAGINIDTYFPDLLRMSLVSPELTERQFVQLVGGTYVDPDDPDAEPEEFDGTLSAGQFQQLADAATAVNMGPISVPFSPSASVILGSSSASSPRPRAGESATSGSADGSPPK